MATPNAKAVSNPELVQSAVRHNDCVVSGDGGITRIGNLLQGNNPNRNAINFTAFQFVGGVSGASDHCTQDIIRAPVPRFYQVRLWFSTRLDVDYTGIRGAIIAATNTDATYTPSVGDTLTENHLTGWVTACGNVTVPKRPYPVATSRSGIYATDWLNVASIPALDGGNPFLAIRVSRADAGLTENDYSSIPGLMSRIKSRRIADTDGASISSGISTATTALNAAGNFNYLSVYRVDFRQTSDACSVDVMGDSTVTSWPHAVRDIWIAESIYPCELAIAGHTSEQIHNNVKEMLQKSCSPYMVQVVFTPNDPDYISYAGVNNQLMRFFDAQRIAKGLGKTTIPIILPLNGLNAIPEYLATRIAAIAELKMSTPCMDARLAIGDPAHDYNRWLPAYSSDGIHPNAAGQAVLQAWFPDAFKTAIGIS